MTREGTTRYDGRRGLPKSKLPAVSSRKRRVTSRKFLSEDLFRVYLGKMGSVDCWKTVDLDQINQHSPRVV